MRSVKAPGRFSTKAFATATLAVPDDSYSILAEPFDDLSWWVLAISVLLLVACSSYPSVNDEPEQQGTAVRMPHPVLSQEEQAACSCVGGTLTAALQLDGSKRRLSLFRLLDHPASVADDPYRYNAAAKRRW
ncbi:hypothetical protein SGGMMB4_03367 [Sodalis glossinidius str. 'morsitans']|uniref:Uncharacterized protein n=1 Tax=Sodalis glossinidius (strain morsitans) TaxID=343509 RepID=A0A193QKD9_SODGM|nr:hypothetical protein [Sodalis glossinidius]CRL45558.1 hypothetical protein SGGMMB4_03367 [Sodalis glossinidius str. 'morsitans']